MRNSAFLQVLHDGKAEGGADQLLGREEGVQGARRAFRGPRLPTEPEIALPPQETPPTPHRLDATPRKYSVSNDSITKTTLNIHILIYVNIHSNT